MNETITPARISDQLLEVVSEFDDAVVIMHDNPDPDAIASGWAVRFLIEQKLGMTPRLLGGGGIVRAENRHMLRLLNPPLELLHSLEVDHETAAILVDCGLNARNHLLRDSAIRPVAVIDHHEAEEEVPEAPFVDVRTRVAASATIAASYLKEQHLEPDPPLATALAYAIRTETCGTETYYSRLDRSITTWLSELANPSWLAEIESAPLPQAYFGDLLLALQNTFIYDDSACCFLPRAEGPEIVGEVADLLVRCESINRVLCAANFGADLYYSVRTDHDAGNAADLAGAIAGVNGQSGGHTHRAGGKIPGFAQGNGEAWNKLRQRWASAWGINAEHGQRLVTRQEIVSNLM